MPDGSRAAATAHRDVRLDFFRGIGMFIIFMAHVPHNPWAQWIPARFGFSDATEIFVFCSGMASAIAFAKIFNARGFWYGCARIAHRCWQVYWAHIGLFIFSVATMAAADQMFQTGNTSVASIHAVRFVETDTGAGLVGLLTLTYVPALFDILPMYLVILTLIPLMMALSRLGAWVPLLASAALWLIATQGYLQFPAEPWGEKHWFFHPFAWQLVFFTGFAFILGWLPAPKVDRRLVAASLVVVLSSMILVVPSLSGALSLPSVWTWMPSVLVDKGHFGGLRYIHFMSVAYLAYVAAGPMGHRLSGSLVQICRKVGQQSLAVFVAGIVLSLIGGVVLKQYDYAPFAITLVNVIGCLGLVIVAYVVAWFKNSPWRDLPHKSTPLSRPTTSQTNHRVA